MVQYVIMEYPKISIIIPVYGVEKCIERCARSLFEQTLKEGIEYIFIDDCTPDKSIEIVKRVLEEYPERKEQVKIVRHEHNRGVAAARNTALDAATGEFVFFVDADDWIENATIETLVSKQLEVGCRRIQLCDTSTHDFSSGGTGSFIFLNMSGGQRY